MSIDTRRDYRTVEEWIKDMGDSVSEEGRLVQIVSDIHANFLSAKKVDFGLEFLRSDPPVTYTPDEYPDTAGDFLMRVKTPKGEILEQLIQVEKKENVSDSRFRFKETRVDLCLKEKQPILDFHHGYKFRAFTFDELKEIDKIPVEISELHGSKNVHVSYTENYKDWLYFSDLKAFKHIKDYVWMIKVLLTGKEPEN